MIRDDRQRRRQPDARSNDDRGRPDDAVAVIALFFFGGEVLKGFAFTMIVGIITGTYSSVFIAAAIVLIWQGRAPVKVAPAAPVAPGTPASKAAGKANKRAS